MYEARILCSFRLLADLLGLLLQLLNLLLGVLAGLGTIRLDLYSALAKALTILFSRCPEGGIATYSALAVTGKLLLPVLLAVLLLVELLLLLLLDLFGTVLGVCSSCQLNSFPQCGIGTRSTRCRWC
jgi:hypothetical protein